MKRRSILHLVAISIFVIGVLGAGDTFGQCGLGESSITQGDFEVCNQTNGTYTTDFVPDSGYERYWDVVGGTIVGSNSGATITVTWNMIGGGTGSVKVFNRQTNQQPCSTPEAQASVTVIGGSGGSVASQTVCQLNNATLTLSGHNGTVVRWEKSTNSGSSWSTVSATTTTLQISGTHSNSDRYRAVVKDACNVEYVSSAASITVETKASLVEISSTVICPQGKSGTLGIEGGTNSSVISWEKKIGAGSWTSVSTNSTLSFYADVTTSYRVTISNGVCGNTQEEITYTATPWVLGGSISPISQSTCGTLSGASALTVSGHAGTSIEWQYLNPVNQTWTFAGSNTNTLSTFPSISASTSQLPVDFRVVMSSSNCGTAVSSTATITIDPPTQAGTLTPPSTTVFCGSGTGSVGLNGSQLGSLQQWELRSKVGAGAWGSWSTIASGSNINFIAVTNLLTLYEVRALIKSYSCAAAYTPAVAITVNPLPTQTASITGNKLFAPGGTLTLAASGTPSGGSYRWYDPSNQEVAPSPASTHQYTASQTVTNHGYVKVMDSNGCLGPQSWYDIVIFSLPVVTAPQNFVVGVTDVALSTGSYEAYSWVNTNSPTVLSTAQSLSTHTPGSYKVTVLKEGVYGTSSSFLLNTQLGGQSINYVEQNVIMVEGVTDENQIVSLPPASLSKSVVYFDGLGRSVQTVTMNASPTLKDLVIPNVYDAAGREYRKFLPVTLTGYGRFTADMIATGNVYKSSYNIYSGSTATIPSDIPYSETVFEQSPLNRVIKQGAPGADWQPNTTHVVGMAYEFNRSDNYHNGAYRVLQFKYITETKILELSPGAAIKYYAAGELSAVKTTDEHGNEVFEFTDKEGHVVCKKVQADATTYACTYYVYDDYGNLVKVLPPEAIKKILATLQ